MKIFNKEYILTKFPLLWNTRFVRFAAIAIGLNILFFALGFFSFVKTDLFESSDFTKVWVVAPSILISFLFLIIWVMHYTRHNAFKDFLPIKRFYLQKEFLLVLVVLCLNTFYLISFQLGYNFSGRLYSNKIEVASKINQLNQAMMFIPISEYAYEVKKVYPALEKHPALTKYDNLKYELNKELGKQIRVEFALEEDDDLSIKSFYLNDLMRKRYPKVFEENYRVKDSIESIQQSEDEQKLEGVEVVSKEEIKQYKITAYAKSYLNQFVSVDTDLIEDTTILVFNGETNRTQGNSWINHKRKDSISQSVNLVITEMRRLGLFCRLKTNNLVRNALQEQPFFNFKTIEVENAYKSSVNGFSQYLNTKNGAGEFYAYQTYLQKVYEFKYKRGFFINANIAQVFSVLLYVVLGLMFFITLFRIIGLKYLMISIVIAGVLSLIIGVFLAFLNSHSEILYLIFFFILALFLSIYGRFIITSTKIKKHIAAIALPIHFVAVLGFIPLFVGIVEFFSQTSYRCASFNSLPCIVEVKRYSLLNAFINKYDDELILAYPWIIFLLFCFYLIPLAIKWRAKAIE